MCQHLMDLGYGMTVYNRTKSKADPLLEAGAIYADSPSEVAAASDVIFTIVGFPPDVREVYLGDNGILKGAKSGSIIVDMTTTEPSLAQEIYAAAQAQDVASVDAPVSGGDVGAKEARPLYYGRWRRGCCASRDAALGIAMGKNIVHQGGAGAGQHTKMCNQITISGTMIGVCEGLIYGHKAGLDLETMLSSISGARSGLLVLRITSHHGCSSGTSIPASS